jgi:hypothetical protein
MKIFLSTLSAILVAAIIIWFVVSAHNAHVAIASAIQREELRKTILEGELQRANVDADVEIVGMLPPAGAGKPEAVLYRVIAPAEVAGKYGTDFTRLSTAEVNSKKGRVYSIHRPEKWRHLLTSAPPMVLSISDGEDFFAAAKPK